MAGGYFLYKRAKHNDSNRLIGGSTYYQRAMSRFSQNELFPGSFQKVKFAHMPDAPFEVKVNAGERVEIVEDRGDWIRIKNAAKEDGLIPRSVFGGSPRSPTAGAALATYGSYNRAQTNPNFLGSARSFGGGSFGSEGPIEPPPGLQHHLSGGSDQSDVNEWNSDRGLISPANNPNKVSGASSVALSMDDI